MNSKITRLLKGARTVAVICNQYGDTGKGKFVDLLAEWADIIARGTGGDNAGHTIRLGNNEYVTHIIPSGILYDRLGKINIIGSGTAINPATVCAELDLLEREGLPYRNLKISQDAKLILPSHVIMDIVSEMVSTGKIGTTCRGIGPTYGDHVMRIGLTVNDLLNGDIFQEKLTRNLRDKILFLKTQDLSEVRKTLVERRKELLRYLDSNDGFNADNIVNDYLVMAERLKPMVTDTDSLMRDSVGSKKILLEGAQGVLISIDKGTYPYVTSSDCSAEGLAKGVGLTIKNVDLVLGIAKAFYMTRVGEGPFPTELGGTKAHEYCASIRKRTEEEKSGFTVNEENAFNQGIGIRLAGREYGATTGRPRRTGWLDLPLLRYSLQFSGPDVVFTKLDVLDECEQIKICDHYSYEGPPVYMGQTLLQKGARITTAIVQDEVLSHCVPIYTPFDGWLSKTSNITDYDKLPTQMKHIISYVCQKTGARARILSVGPDRNQTIFVDQ